jgi:hypothetical protein
MVEQGDEDQITRFRIGCNILFSRKNGFKEGLRLSLNPRVAEAAAACKEK